MKTPNRSAKLALGPYCKSRAAWVVALASALYAVTASAAPPLAVEVLDQAALTSAHAPPSTPVAANAVAIHYGEWLQNTIQKFPDLKAGILSLDGAFFSRQSSPEVNQAVRLADGTEVLLMAGCRNLSLCSETGYLLGSDFTHRQLALLEVVNPGQPRSYRFVGSREPALRALLLAQGLKVFAKAAPDRVAAALKGVKASAASQENAPFGQKSAIATSVHRVYPGSDSLAIVKDSCGVQMADGRLFALFSAQSSDAEGDVSHAIAVEDKSKKVFVYRAEGQLGKEEWFGNPDAALRTLLSVASDGCSALRGKLGLDPNGQETSATPASAPSAAGASTACSQAAYPLPGSYTKAGAPRFTLTVGSDCQGVVLSDSGAPVVKGTAQDQTKNAAGQPIPVFREGMGLDPGEEMPSGCWAYSFGRSKAGGVDVAWAQNFIAAGKGVAPNCREIAGEYKSSSGAPGHLVAPAPRAKGALPPGSNGHCATGEQGGVGYYCKDGFRYPN